MTIYFTNLGRHIAVLEIDDVDSIILPAFETVPITLMDTNSLKVLVKRDCDSHISKKKREIKHYNLVIETKYLVSELFDGAIFYVAREKIRLTIDTYYDRLFLRMPANLHYSEKHKVSEEKKIKKSFKKSRWFHFLLFGPLDNSTELFILLLIIGIVLTVLFGVNVAVVFFPLAYFFLVMFNWIIEKFVSTAFKKGFDVKEEKKEFFEFFDSDFIKNYYSGSNSQPFMGIVETD